MASVSKGQTDLSFIMDLRLELPGSDSFRAIAGKNSGFWALLWLQSGQLGVGRCELLYCGENRL